MIDPAEQLGSPEDGGYVGDARIWQAEPGVPHESEDSDVAKRLTAELINLFGLQGEETGTAGESAPAEDVAAEESGVPEVGPAFERPDACPVPGTRTGPHVVITVREWETGRKVRVPMPVINTGGAGAGENVGDYRNAPSLGIGQAARRLGSKVLDAAKEGVAVTGEVVGEAADQFAESRRNAAEERQRLRNEPKPAKRYRKELNAYFDLIVTGRLNTGGELPAVVRDRLQRMAKMNCRYDLPYGYGIVNREGRLLLVRDETLTD